MIPLSAIARCCEGAVPAIIATSAADGTPNITFLSRVQLVDDERVALSNQFLSKTARNLAENPRASVVLIDPLTYGQFRLTLVFERTERRGLVFERLRADVDLIAAITNMQDVFRLRAADIYRVLDIEELPPNTDRPPPQTRRRQRPPADDAAANLARLTGRMNRCGDLDTLVDATLAGLEELLGHPNSMFLLIDEDGRRLYTIGSHGYAAEGIGSEVALGDGAIGIAAQRCEALRLNGVRQMEKYSRSVRQSFDEDTDGPGIDIPVPEAGRVDSRLAVPAMAFGQLVGVLMVETADALAYDDVDEAQLSVVASMLALAVEAERVDDAALPAAPAAAPAAVPDPPPADTAPSTDAPTDAPTEAPPVGASVRFYEADGSVFCDGDYVIRGVAGRVLWSVLVQNQVNGRVEFTNKELRLDTSLGLPSFRDNLDSRLLLLKRRLDERELPIRIERTGRGRFELRLSQPPRLESVPAPT